MVRISHRPNLLRRFRSGGLWARAGALAGIIAILLQGVVAVAHDVQLARMDMRAQGYRLALGALAPAVFCGVGRSDGRAPAGSGSEHGLPACPLCQALHQYGAWLPPTNQWVLANGPRSDIASIEYASFPPARPAYLGTRARAPPEAS